ncbi:MAG: creatininase family protein [Oscillospiraceae bacterium]|nr:creatininase family protein [Oscillospiraceae bacterium]
MLWDELTSKDFEKAVDKCDGVCVLPMGVLEKHGDHLPLGTDMYIATETVKAAAQKSPAVVFPYYFMGQILEARHASGTIAPSHNLIMDTLLVMCDEIHRNGFKKILLLSGHGGNYHFLPFFAQMFPGLNRDYAVYTAYIHDGSLEELKEIQDKTGMTDMGGHGGFYETALIEYLRPELVHMDRVKVEESAAMGRLDKVKEAGVYSGFGWYADYPHHFAGDPTGSSSENGKIIFDIVTRRLVRLINAVKEDDVTLKLIKEFNGRTDNPKG